MFKPYKITLHHVHDRVKVSEGSEALILTVDEDPMRLVRGITLAQQRMQTVTNESTQDEITDIARSFAAVIFGDAQSEKLLAFYGNNPACVIDICAKYLNQRLEKLIVKAQKSK